MAHDISEACKRRLAGIFSLVYYLSLDSAIEFPCAAAAAAAQSPGRERGWFLKWNRRNKQGYLWGKRIIVEKVRVVSANNKWTACRDVEAKEQLIGGVLLLRSSIQIDTQWAKNKLPQNQIGTNTSHFGLRKKASMQTNEAPKSCHCCAIFRRAGNTQRQERTHRNT